MITTELHIHGPSVVQSDNRDIRSRFESLLLCIVLLELFLMGSGRLLELGPVTLRMLLFCLCLFSAAYNIATGRKGVSQFLFFLVGSYLVLMLEATFLGYISLSDPSLVFEDVKPLIYFLMVVYFEMTITDSSRIRLVSSLVKIAAVTMAIIYLMLICMVYSGIVDFSQVYGWVGSSSEFMFRGETGEAGLFYKGFLYICVGLIFFLFDGTSKSFLAVTLLVPAILLTFTKGFVVALIPTILIGYYILSKKWVAVAAVALILTAAAVFLFLNWFQVLGDKSESDMLRIVTAQQVAEATTVPSVLVGQGFGQGVYERPMHMETSLLEVFHKQGVPGVAFWIMLLGCIVRYYCLAASRHNQRIALPFALSAFFIYGQSISNPFMNNPIGMSFLLISLVTLRVLSTSDQGGGRHDIRRHRAL